jgi:hypothetical protein
MTPMTALLYFKDRLETLSFSADSAPAEGLVLEFGVASGDTIRHLASAPSMRGRTIHGFDSFKGLPERWSGYAAGHFACEPPEVPANVELIIGLFADTLPPFLATHDGNAALIHIDCDLYASTWQVLHFLNERIVPGTIIQMDEYWIVKEHESRAFHDWLTAKKRKCAMIARSHEQLVVVID